ncbi:MAG: UDP-N-acetylmuramoylalanine--D-glutamate ligase [Parcubacteria group bacterium Gr01-1014_3]|nr:MAG: UDP-N-acetylmuramoylalanine--D-glutamate ligase [Parcubacteria group bacterium Gr01-1014_3]
MKIAILGFGREGKAVFKFLSARGGSSFGGKKNKYKKATIEVLDQKHGQDYLKDLDTFDLVFRSPGVPYNRPEIQRAIKNGVKFSSVTKLFFELCPAKVIGITGTKGKGTTATLLYKILKASGADVHLAGNIGKPAIDILPKLRNSSTVILELSSFQLQDLGQSPPISIVTETFEDHMDAHKSVKEYLDAKTNIARHQKKDDVIFYFADSDWAKKIALKSPAKKIAVYGGSFGLKKNFVMAATVAAYLGVDRKFIVRTLKNFPGIKHRMELVAENCGVRFYNDSASTNPRTTAAAILEFTNTLNAKPYPLVLIAGGKDKNLDYAPLATTLANTSHVKTVILLGENKNKVFEKLKIENLKLKIELADDLEIAVKNAYQSAKIYGGAVLFSPGAASFDMFKDYQDRGEQFKEIVKKLKK